MPACNESIVSCEWAERMLGCGDSAVLPWHLDLAALLGLYTMKRRCSKRKWCRSTAQTCPVSTYAMRHSSGGRSLYIAVGIQTVILVTRLHWPLPKPLHRQREWQTT